MNVIKSALALAKSCGGFLLNSAQKPTKSYLPVLGMTSVRSYAVDYDPNPEFKSRSPYKIPRPFRHGYKGKIFTGGLLPRHDGPDVKPLPSAKYNPKNPWRSQKALFGQNDYIDILGDGELQPYHLTKGPKWLRGGFKGDEYMTLIRRLKFQRLQLQEYRPTRYHQIQKQVKYLYRKLNHRRHRGWYKGEF